MLLSRPSQPRSVFVWKPVNPKWFQNPIEADLHLETLDGFLSVICILHICTFMASLHSRPTSVPPDAVPSGRRPRNGPAFVPWASGKFSTKRRNSWWLTLFGSRLARGENKARTAGARVLGPFWRSVFWGGGREPKHDHCVEMRKGGCFIGGQIDLDRDWIQELV